MDLILSTVYAGVVTIVHGVIIIITTKFEMWQFQSTLFKGACTLKNMKPLKITL